MTYLTANSSTFFMNYNIFKGGSLCMGMVFLIWGMMLITVFVLSDTVEDFLDAREKRKRHRRRYFEDEKWELKD